MITKFKIFEQEHYDVDPYGEENWNPEEIVVNTVTPKLSDDRQNSFWYYGDTIANVTNGEHTVTVFANGDIGVIFEENGSKYVNMQAVEYAFRKGLKDKDLDKIGEWDGWINNNWFEMEVDGRDTGFIDVIADEYDEAVECAKGIIKEL